MLNTTHQEIINYGKKCIIDEKNALDLLADKLDETFAHVIEVLLNIKGRVVLTGMGKSGHIAKKISASFASTGCPSFFLHPSEASHGDLGMITSDDIIVALSNSGNTNELTDVLHYGHTHHIMIIGITQNPQSFLAEIADYTLFIEQKKELGELQLAPTTSTIQMLALGDALCISLLELKGFNAKDFANFHPGGRLGQRLLSVEQIMHRDNLPLISQDLIMQEAIISMASKPFGIIGVINREQQLIGIITDGDLRRAMSPDFLKKKAKDIMNKTPFYARKTMLAVHVVSVMNEHKFNVTFVVDEQDNNKAIGIIHIHDIIRAGVI